MTSAELRAAKAEFDAKISSVISKYNSANSKLKSINSTINSSSNDTLSLRAVVNKNDNISVKINAIVSDIITEKANIDSKIDAEIDRLEAAERAAAELESTKKNNSDKTTTLS